jgi:hypothetical protein
MVTPGARGTAAARASFVLPPPHASLLLLLLLSAAATPAAAPAHARYVVLGAGPGGLQLAHYLDSAGRDYIVLEQAAQPASFFEHYPRWRQLISINKARTGRDELDFNLRHDWNSLLSEPSHARQAQLAAAGAASSTHATHVLDAPLRRSGLLFSAYTSAYYPEADRLVAYMRDWAAGTAGTHANASSAAADAGTDADADAAAADANADAAAAAAATSAASGDAAAPAHPQRPLRIVYNASVVRVARAPASAPHGARFALELAGGERVTCTYLVVATGLQDVVPALGVNAAEALARGWVSSYSNASTQLELYRGRSVLLLGRGNAAFEFANSVLEVAAYVHLLGRSGGRVRLASETHYPGDVRSVHSHLLETYLLKSMDAMAEAPLEHLRFGFDALTNRTTLEDVYNPCTRDAHGRAVSRCLFKREYDFVISCPGWRFADALFDAEVRPRLHANGKHPAISPRFESANVRGLFFAGTLMHGLDHKKSSGGFIHGFRYLVRALHRILEEQEADDDAAASAAAAKAAAAAAADVVDVAASSIPRLLPPPARWPRTELRACGLRGLVAAVLRRINLASGTYQMFGGLVDVFVLDPLAPGEAAGFVGVGDLAALQEPWSFPPPPAGCAAAAAEDIFAPLFVPRPADAAAPSATQAASDAAIERALRATLFEEVPVGIAASRASAWAAEAKDAAPSTIVSVSARASATAAAASAGATAPAAAAVDYITLSLEFGTGSSSHAPAGSRKEDLDIARDAKAYMKARSEWARDPYSRLRANVGLHNPEASHFLHPVGSPLPPQSALTCAP